MGLYTSQCIRLHGLSQLRKVVCVTRGSTMKATTGVSEGLAAETCAASERTCVRANTLGQLLARIGVQERDPNKPGKKGESEAEEDAVSDRVSSRCRLSRLMLLLLLLVVLVVVLVVVRVVYLVLLELPDVLVNTTMVLWSLLGGGNIRSIARIANSISDHGISDNSSLVTLHINSLHVVDILCICKQLLLMP